MLEQLEDSNGDVSSGDDSAYKGEGIVRYLYSFMPDADELHDMDLDASAMDQDRERPGEYSIARISVVSIV